MKEFLIWSELDYIWSNIFNRDGLMIWSDISIIREVERIFRGGGIRSEIQSEYERGNPWKKISENLGEEKTERFIKIFCTVNNIEYERGKFIKENIKVSVSQFEKVFNESIKVKIDFQK